MVVSWLVAGVAVFSCKDASKDRSAPPSTPQAASVKSEEASGTSKPPDAGSNFSAEEIEDNRVAARIEAIQALEDSNDANAITALANALSDPNRDVKEAALQALADKKGTKVTQLIRQALNDADPEFRMEVLDVLADRDDRESLLKAKSDPNQEVRERAAELLESIGR